MGRVLGPLWILAFWQIAAMLDLLPDYVLPDIQTVVGALWAARSSILANALVTVQEILIGLAIATCAAIVIGGLLVRIPTARRIAYPLIVAAQTAPKEVLAPILIIWFGFSMLPKVLVAAMIAFFPMLVGIIAGLEQFDRRLDTLARSMGASRLKTFVSFRLWDAMPSFFSSLRLGVTLATVGAVVAEFLGADQGVGYLIISASRRLDGGLLFANIFVLVLVSLTLVWSVDLCERRLLKVPNSRLAS